MGESEVKDPTKEFFSDLIFAGTFADSAAGVLQIHSAPRLETRETY